MNWIFLNKLVQATDDPNIPQGVYFEAVKHYEAGKLHESDYMEHLQEMLTNCQRHQVFYWVELYGCKSGYGASSKSELMGYGSLMKDDAIPMYKSGHLLSGIAKYICRGCEQKCEGLVVLIMGLVDPGRCTYERGDVVCVNP